MCVCVCECVCVCVCVCVFFTVSSLFCLVLSVITGLIMLPEDIIFSLAEVFSGSNKERNCTTLCWISLQGMLH